jgi:hypothetical protein
METPYEIILIGDTGDIYTGGHDHNMRLLKSQLPESENSMVIVLGDLIYPNGLTEEHRVGRDKGEKILNEYKEIFKEYKGKLVFISGNHDWNECRKNGHEYLVRLENYMVELFGNKDILLPHNGCPGPVALDVTENVSVIIINTQWWLQDGFRPIGKDCGCSVKDEQDFFATLNRMLYERKDKQVLVVGHNPIHSFSIHGGKYHLKHHIFPFTIYKKHAWLPLPFIGSLLPMFRKYIGAREDISHYRYRRVRKKLGLIFRRYPGLIYACGHEHNLQHIEKHHNHFIVSGSGSKVKYVVRSGKTLKFGLNKLGFFKLKVYKKGETLCECFAIRERHKQGEKVYETILS